MHQQCSMCPFFTNSRSELIYHLLHRHRNSSNFMIHCSGLGCGASFRNVDTFRKHCERKHGKDDTIGPHDHTIDDDADIEYEDNRVEHITKQEMQFQDAFYVLKLKAGHNMSNTAVQEIMISTGTLISRYMEEAEETLIQMLPPHVATMIDLQAVFRYHPFEGLETDYLQEKYLENHAGYIKPTEVKLGETLKTAKVQGQHRYIPCEIKGYTIPLFLQLSKLLSMPEVQRSLAHAKDRDDQFEFSDFTDGTYMQKDFFISHPEALRFCLYCDDFEVANPIGSHKKKHKVTIMYWSLLNIEPEFRFKLQCTQLLAVAKTSDVKKFGLEPLLKDFVSSMKKLHGGYELMIDGKSKLFYGTLLCVVGDTPAAQFLGGFKEGVGFAEKPCRTCDISRDDLHRSEAPTFPLRSELEHRDRCENLSSLSRASRQYWSKRYGVVSASILLDIPDFSVTKCILHDPMHVLLEGIVKMELQLLLEHFIDKQKYFTLKDLNRVILNFDYGPDRMQDRPQPLERKSLDRKHVFPMTAVETLHFMMTLPFLIGDRVPEDDAYWMNFLILLQITQLVISPTASLVSIDHLRQLIWSHNTSFRRLYPGVNFTPKLHYLTHFPDQIREFGPGRNHWCMRFEAKHGLFKSKKWRNFRNLPHSLALHHQRWMCLQQMGSMRFSSEVYLYKGDTVKEGISVTLESLNDTTKDKIMDTVETLPSELLCTPCVTIRDVTYRYGSVLLLKYAEFEEPQFAQIEKIYVVHQAKFVECAVLEIIEFSSHLNAFECLQTTRKICLDMVDLQYKWPQSLYNIEGKLMVALHNVDFAWSL